MINIKYNQAFTEFLIILFDTIVALVLIPMWISCFSRLREIEKQMAILQENVKWLIREQSYLIGMKNNQSDSSL